MNLLKALIVVWGGSGLCVIGALTYLDLVDRWRNRRAVRKEWEL